MNKKRSSSLVISLLLIIFLNIFFVSATALDLKITGEVNNLSSDVWLKTDANAVVGEDAYDLPAPSSPDSISVFSSNVSGVTMSIDSYAEAERTFNLKYTAPSVQTGTLTFSWDASSISSVLVASLKYYADDSTYTTQVGGDVDMNTDSSYTAELTGKDSIYVQVVMADYVAPAVVEEVVSSGGGGGGGAASPTTVTQPSIDIIVNLDPTRLLFDAEMVINDEFSSIFEGDKMQSTISLIPMGVSPNLDVFLTYTIKNLQGKEFPVGKGKTIKITGQESLDELFNTAMLPPGDYVLELELKYDSDPSDVTKFEFAYASSQFRVEPREVEGQGLLAALSGYKIVVFALGFGMIILIILIIIVLKKTGKSKRRK